MAFLFLDKYKRPPYLLHAIYSQLELNRIISLGVPMAVVWATHDDYYFCASGQRLRCRYSRPFVYPVPLYTVVVYTELRAMQFRDTYLRPTYL